jgi:hypothetical protein
MIMDNVYHSNIVSSHYPPGVAGNLESLEVPYAY